MSELPLVVLLGSNGKLGSEFKSRFTSEGIDHLTLDTRLADWQEKIPNTRNIILDLSGRNRNLEDVTAPKIGQENRENFLKFIAASMTPYVKLASALILYDENPRISYAAQSSSEVQELLDQAEMSAFPLYILYTHSVFGGKYTNSLVDQVQSNRKELRSTISLDDPYDVRDFIHFDLIYRTVVDSLHSVSKMEPIVVRFEVGTGSGYQLQDLIMYAESKIDELIPRVSPKYESLVLLEGQRIIVAGRSKRKIQVLHLEDELVNYLG
jgi:hypothetical protein